MSRNGTRVLLAGILFFGVYAHEASLKRFVENHSETASAQTALTASCAPSRTSSWTGVTVTWTATASGGTGSYTYSWTGTDSLTGTAASVGKNYTTAGVKTASVTVTSGAETKTVACSQSVTVQTANLTGTCSVSPTSVTEGTTVNFTSSGVSGGNGTYTYSWSIQSVSPVSVYTGSTASLSFKPRVGNYSIVRVTIGSDGMTRTVSCGTLTVSKIAIDYTAGGTVLSSPTVVLGKPITFSAQGKNIGSSTSAAATPFYFDIATIFSYAADGTPNYMPGEAVQGNDLPALAPNAGATSTATWTADLKGQVYVRACANYEPVECTWFNPEYDQDNNCGPYTPLTVTAADLTAGTSTPASLIVTGSPTTISAPIRNVGDGASDPFPVRFEIYSATTSTINIESSYVASIAANGTATATISYTFPYAGNFRIKACANQNASSTNIVTESSYYAGSAGANSNCGPSIFYATVQGNPDLSAGAVSMSSFQSGTPITFTALASNAGNAPSGSFPMLFEIENGAVWNSAYGSSIAVGGSQFMSATRTLTAGTYRVRACTNYNTSWVAIVTESNYGNNCGSWSTVTITDPVLTCTVSNQSPPLNTSVTYTATGGSAPYTWTAADGGSYGTNSTATRTFTSAGNYGMTVSKTGYTGGTCPVVTAGCLNPSATISASPARVWSGQSVTVSWSATGVDTSCTISGPGVSQTVAGNACVVSSGSATITPTEQSVYRISCDAGESTDEVIVNLIPGLIEF